MYYMIQEPAAQGREKDLGGKKEPRRQGGARGPEVRNAAEVRREEAAAWRPERRGGG